jgi:hypothetical protein
MRVRSRIFPQNTHHLLRLSKSILQPFSDPVCETVSDAIAFSGMMHSETTAANWIFHQEKSNLTKARNSTEFLKCLRHGINRQTRQSGWYS